jgi:hypothetical protein
MARKVFISYRRDDSRYQARMIYHAFERVLGRESVFMDVDSISPGSNYRKILKEWVDQCDVLLALIGPGWIDAADPQTGQCRATIETTSCALRSARRSPAVFLWSLYCSTAPHARARSPARRPQSPRPTGRDCAVPHVRSDARLIRETGTAGGAQ